MLWKDIRCKLPSRYYKWGFYVFLLGLWLDAVNCRQRHLVTIYEPFKIIWINWNSNEWKIFTIDQFVQKCSIFENSRTKSPTNTARISRRIQSSGSIRVSQGRPDNRSLWPTPHHPRSGSCGLKNLLKVFDLRIKNIININDLVRPKRVRNLQNLDISNNLKLGHPFDLSGFKDLDKDSAINYDSYQIWICPNASLKSKL